MTKTKEQILASFKKANKAARERMATKAGFKSAEDYRVHLEGANKGTKNKPTIHIVTVLDRSGSMDIDNKLKNAISGINSEIAELQRDNTVNYTYTYVAFDNTIKIPLFKQPINEVASIHEHPGYTTALNQAVGETIEKLIKTDDQK